MPSSASRKSKKTVPAMPEPETETAAPEPEPEPAAAPAPAPAPKKKKQAPAPPASPEPETDHAPTFPNIVILKQTEHNYIVKHNIDPKTDTAGGGGGSEHASEDTDDLVTPNQIHKNQINKKRGRKPKAGLISNTSSNLSDITEVPNIILHLKCHMSDLKTNDSISNYGYTPAIEEVESYNISNTSIHSSDIGNLNKEEDDEPCEYNNNDDDNNYQNHSDNRGDNGDKRGDNFKLYSTMGNCCAAPATNATTSPATNASAASAGAVVAPATNSAAAASTSMMIRNINIIQERNSKEIMKKINRLKYSFHNGEPLQSKINHKSACFWDTCDFDTQMYYIPVMIVNDIFQVYGCFCSAECAVAFLLKEPIDTSTKFERLHLIQLLYGNPNGRGIKPAPNPYYLLDKYYGNLTIQEYRQLLKGPQLIHIVNKPLTHILPELYEDNNDFLVNSKVIPTNNLKLKKRYKTMVVQNSDA
jgi:hypothetical protein